MSYEKQLYFSMQNKIAKIDMKYLELQHEMIQFETMFSLKQEITFLNFYKNATQNMKRNL